MDVKRFKEAHVDALVRRKPLVPLMTSNVPSSSCEQAMIVADCPSDYLNFLLRKKSTRRKRKVTNSSTSPFCQRETIELVNVDE